MTDSPSTRAPRQRAARPLVTSPGGWSKVQITWPVVAALGLLLSSIVALLALVPPDDQRAGTVLAMLVNGIVSLLTALFVSRRTENAVQQQPEPAPEPAPEPTYPPFQRPTGQPERPGDPPTPNLDRW